MNLRTPAALLAPALTAACAAPEPGPDLQRYCGADAAAVEARIDHILAGLSDAERARLTRGDFFADNAWIARGLPERGVPDLTFIDGPRGVGKLAGRATAFPVAMARGATWDPALERRVGEAIGRETRAHGIGVLLAPTMNLLTHPRWGRAQETYGEDPLHVALLAAAFVEGAQTQVLATAKHFAANNIENNRLIVDARIDERTLREVYLPHFAHVVRSANVAAVMSAYNSVNGAFCSENAPLLRDILKGEWGFAGLVMSDWVFGTHHTAAAARAGLDLEMPAENIYGAPLLAAVADGTVDASLLSEMVRRRLRASLCHGARGEPPAPDPAQLETAASRALAQEVAERSLVLLVNRQGALPLGRGAGRTVAVVGRLADVANLGDSGSSQVTPSSAVTPLQGLRAHAGPTQVLHVPGDLSDAPARAALAAADAVIAVVGLGAEDEGEHMIGSGDRASLALRGEDLDLLRAAAALSPRVIVVLEGGAAVTMDEFLPQVEAVLLAWYPGVAGGDAIARALFGDVNPSGRLPMVFPQAESQLPPFDNTSTTVTYGYYHGYRHFDHSDNAPLFPFGFGLSYTRYAYERLVLSSPQARGEDVLRVSVDVHNVGAVAGRETVQVYVGPHQSAVTPRFVRDLRGFAQVDLQPGEVRTVHIDVPVASLAFWDPARRAFVVEPTEYRVEVGGSSRDLPLSADLTVR